MNTYIYDIVSIELHALFKNENTPILHNIFLRGCNIKEFIDCDRSKQAVSTFEMFIKSYFEYMLFNLKNLLRDI